MLSPKRHFLGFYENYTICFVFMRSFALHANDFPILAFPDNTSFLIAAYWTGIILANFIFHFLLLSDSGFELASASFYVSPNLGGHALKHSVHVSSRSIYFNSHRLFGQPNRISVSAVKLHPFVEKLKFFYARWDFYKTQNPKKVKAFFS